MPSDSDVPPTSPISTGSSRAHRAEDELGAGGRTLPQLASPVVAVVPWLVTMAGLALAGEWQVRYAVRFEASLGWLLASAAVLVLAALIWGALTVWSSAGATVAGLLTIAGGVLMALPEVYREVLTTVGDLVGGGRWVYYVLTAPNLVLTGSLLLAAGIGAAGARRLRRR